VFRVCKSSKEVTVGSVACTCRTVVIDQTLASNGYGATLCTMTSVFFSKFLKEAGCNHAQEDLAKSG
jgi:hypothetical protein